MSDRVKIEVTLAGQRVAVVKALRGMADSLAAPSRSEVMGDARESHVERLYRERLGVAPPAGSAEVHTDSCVGRVHDSLGCSCGRTAETGCAKERDRLRAADAGGEARDALEDASLLALRDQYDAATRAAMDSGESVARLAKDLNALREKVRALAEEWQRTSRGWNVSRRAGMRDCAAALRALVADGEGGEA